MRKVNLIAAAVLAMAMTACNTQELELNDYKLGEDEFGFAIEKVTATRASAEEAPAPVTFELGNSGFYLTETVTELDYDTPATKGTPIYTENIDQYYPAINVVGYQQGGSDVFVPEASYEFFNNNASENRKVYSHHYSSDFWPAEDQEQTLWFFLKAPQDYLDETATDFEYGTSDGSIEFDYGSPLNGENQKDILFTSRTLTKAEYFDNPNFHSQGGAPVTFYHALTAVKFRTANDNAGTTKTIITKVEFTGLNASGHCKVTPTGNVSKENVAWSNLGTNGVVFTQEFENSAYSKEANVDNTIDYDSSNSNFGSSWTSAASTKNLNDEDGSLTFWFIPQEISEDVTLKVTFRVKTPDTPNGTEITHTIKIGETLNAQGVEWKAGQLRTYTLKPLDVDVDIFDTMEGWIKNDVHVTNTGNVHEYVRMTFVGNWYDANGDIVVGYKYAGDETNLPEGTDIDEMVLPWYGSGYPCTDPNDPSTIDLSLEDDETWKADKKYADPYGYFDESFLLTNIAEGSKWVRASGGYYYKEPIGPGVELDSKTQALFQSYTLTNVPTIYVPTAGSSTRVPAEGIHLVFEMAVQAIYAPVDENGDETSTWYAEWYDATGNPKLNPTTIPDSWN